MRSPRIKETCGDYYHIISRIVDRQRVLDQDEKERFRTLLRATESFSGCRALAYLRRPSLHDDGSPPPANPLTA